ncbi:MAG: phage tail tube protein, partial [Clostridia bacterium]
MAIPNIPPAYMGYVGFIRFRTIDGNYIVRATSTSLAAKQEITKPNVIDSRYDMTVYQLGPKEMEGDVSFPAIYDPQGGASVIKSLYKHAVTRDALIGSLLEADIDVRYAPNDGASHMADFNYLGCIVNTFKFSVAQSDAVNITVGVIAKDRVEPGFSGNNSLSFTEFDPFNLDDTTGSGTGTYGTAKENS